VPATGGRQRPVQVDMHTDNGRHAFAKSVAGGGEPVCGVLSTMGSASSSQPKVNRTGMSGVSGLTGAIPLSRPNYPAATCFLP
jgi:hypothetical protein